MCRHAVVFRVEMQFHGMDLVTIKISVLNLNSAGLELDLSDSVKEFEQIKMPGGVGHC